MLAAAIPLALLGIRIGMESTSPNPTTDSPAFESRAHAVIFLGPALLFLSSALVNPRGDSARSSCPSLDRNFTTGVTSKATRSTASPPRAMPSSASTTTASVVERQSTRSS